MLRGYPQMLAYNPGDTLSDASAWATLNVLTGYVAFFNRSLSTADVAGIYSAALGQSPPPTKLEWAVSPSGLVLTWSGPWTLMQADAVTGAWTPATGVVSGTPIPMTSTRKFYRLQH